MARWVSVYNHLAPIENEVYCSIAVGTAYGIAPEKFDDVICRADENMYADKRKHKRKNGPTPLQE